LPWQKERKQKENPKDKLVHHPENMIRDIRQNNQVKGEVNGVEPIMNDGAIVQIKEEPGYKKE